MENKGYLIYEVGILGGNDKGEIKFILFPMFFIRMEDSYTTMFMKDILLGRVLYVITVLFRTIRL